WRALSSWRAHQHRLCRINGQSGDPQAHGKNTTDAMDPTRRPSPAADSHTGVERRVGRDVPHLVSRFPVPYTTYGGLNPMAGGLATLRQYDRRPTIPTSWCPLYFEPSHWGRSDRKAILSDSWKPDSTSRYHLRSRSSPRTRCAICWPSSPTN